MSAIQPFSIAVPLAVLDDLDERLARTRWTDDFANEDWRYGANAGYLKALVDYWAVDWDWRDDKPFENQWQDFRTRKKKTILTETTHTYAERGEKRVVETPAPREGATVLV